MRVRSVVDRLDHEYVLDTLGALARVPAEVPLGADVFIAPDDPKLVHYVQRVLRPEFAAVGARDLMDVPGNQFAARYGQGRSGRTLLIQVYTPVQHNNLTADPLSGKIANAARHGFDEPALFGQGVSQNKAHQAIALGILKLLHDRQIPLAGTLYVAVNNEGRSSHACSEAVLDALGAKPDFAVLMTATGQRISLGNRGRVDVNVTVRGKAVHSSAPGDGLSAIDGAWEAMRRIRAMELPGAHELLGARRVLPYQLTFAPLAPHTLPETAFMRVDRRMLPGDDPAAATEEVRRAVGDMAPWEAEIEQGPHMLPALVDPGHPGVRALAAAHAAVHGAEPERFYGQGTFDAGGLCAAGAPAVMYGVGGPAGVLDDDFVPLSHLRDVARTMAQAVLTFLE